MKLKLLIILLSKFKETRSWLVCFHELFLPFSINLFRLDIDGWLSLSPALRIPKRKDGKDGSESSSTSSSDEDKNKNNISVKANANIKAPEVSVGGKGKLEVRGGVSNNNNNKHKRVSVKQDNIIRLGAICSMCSVKFSFFKRPVSIFFLTQFLYTTNFFYE